MKITINSTDIDTTSEGFDDGIQAAVDSANNARTLDSDGNPIGDEQTPESYLVTRLREVLASYAAQVDSKKIEDFAKAYKEASPADKASLDAAVASISVKSGGISVKG